MRSLRQYTGKKLVALLRENDFAHAGESEAIDRVMSYFDKIPYQSILDVGCGLGGTAQYIQAHGWGTVSGFDIEADAIDYAHQHYPDIRFYTCDVEVCHQRIQASFDIVTAFNAFYAFPDPTLALKALNTITQPRGRLAIFDYSDPCSNQTTPLFRAGDKDTTPFIPIKLSQIDALLKDTGWETLNRVDISNQYLIWYDQLIKHLLNKTSVICHTFDKAMFENALKTYSNIKDALLEGVLGGTIIYAQKS